MKNPSDSKKYLQIIFHSKPVIIAFLVAVVSLLALLTVKIVGRVQQIQFERELELETQVSYTEPELVLTKDDLKYGKYYLNGDRNNYYFQIKEDDTIEFVCDDMYSVFEKWNPGNPDAIQSLCDEHNGPRKFTTKEMCTGELLIRTELIWDEKRNEYVGGSGPALTDYNRIKWGIEGDFIYLEDAQEDSSVVDQSEAQ